MGGLVGQDEYLVNAFLAQAAEGFFEFRGVYDFLRHGNWFYEWVAEALVMGHYLVMDYYLHAVRTFIVEYGLAVAFWDVGRSLFLE